MTSEYTARQVFSNDSDISVLFNSPGRLKWAYLEYVSTATAGNRQVEIRFKDSAGNVLFSAAAGAVQAASLTRKYLFLPDSAREAAFVSNGITIPIPSCLIPAGGSVQILDTAAIDAAADDLTLTYGFEPQ